MRSRTIAWSFLSLLFYCTSAGAQWTQVGSFPYPMNSAWFWDPSNGIIGSGHTTISNPVTIWRTTDAGQHWLQCTTPSGYKGSVSRIFMVTCDTGWASVLPWGGSGSIRLWKTVDGGSSWFEVGPRGTGDGVYQNGNVLIETDLDPSVRGGISTDGGVTFDNIWPGRTTGIDFTDSLHGIVTVFREGPWQATSDGGLTWNALNMTDEAWSIYAVKGTNTYYTCGESYAPGTTICKRSTDQGQTWTTQCVLGFQTSGHVAGFGEDVLYIQTVNESPHPSGVLRSTDKGKTWEDIGGPRNWFDSRFWLWACSSHRVLYAFDEKGGVYRYSEGSDSSIAIGLRVVPWQHAVEGDCVTKVDIYPSAPLPAGTLTGIEFDLLYDTDLLTELIQSAPANLSVQEVPISGGRHYTLTGSSIQLDSLVSLLTISYKTAISRSQRTSLRLANVGLHTVSPISGPCAPTVTSRGDSLSLIGCPVALISEFMSSGTFKLVAISPNPSNAKAPLRITIEDTRAEALEATVTDNLGRIQYRSTIEQEVGKEAHELQLGALRPGSYILRVAAATGEVRSQSFVIQ